MWSVECGAFCCVCVCLCLCLSLYGREVTVGYARLRGSMGATFCHLAALRSAIEFLFWDHWETAVLGQILAGRSREVTGGHGRSREVTGGHGSKLMPFGGPSAAYWISLLWSLGHGRFGPNPGREVMGGHGRLRVTGGYGGGKRRKVEERQEKGLKKTKEYEGSSLKSAGKRRKMEELRSSTGSSVCWGSEQDSLQGDEKWYWGRGGEGLQSKEKSSKGAADGLGFCSYNPIRAKGWLAPPFSGNYTSHVLHRKARIRAAFSMLRCKRALVLAGLTWYGYIRIRYVA